LQNKYWEMHDKLYENQNEWSASSSALDVFSKYAQQIGLDINRFKQDYSSSQVNGAINSDLAAFKITNQDQATPTFFVNGRYVPNSEFVDPQTGAPTAASIAKLIQSEIAKKTAPTNQ